MTVYAGTTLATLESVDFPAGAVNAVSGDATVTAEADVEKLEMLWGLVERAGPDLSPGEKDMFFHLLLSYSDVIASSTADLGRTDRLQHSIHTGDAPPIRQSVRRVPPQRREEVRKLLDDMLEGGVVEPSTSPWAAPIVLVRKKDGSTRFCVDYRKLNDVTRKDVYPLPRIDATLDTLSGSQWFSTLDLLSGYWQVGIEEADRPNTAFCTTEGLFQFKWSECLVYLDDVIVLGRSFEEHLRNLRSVFQRLRESGLHLKPSKCSFFQSEVQYLGHIISRDGVATDPAKIEKVADGPAPTTKREAQQF